MPALFDTEGGAFYDIKGKYVGWVKTDGATEHEWGKLWKSNFFQDDTDYATITVDPNLDGDHNYKTKTYTVLKGTEIKVPYFNYIFTQGTDNKYFSGWTIANDVKKFAGDVVKVEGNMTFTADWTDAAPTQSTSVDVVFRDSDNVDGLRPSSIGITFNDNGSASITAENSWHYESTSAIYAIAPNWNGIKGGGYGTDAADSYRYEVTGDAGNGYVITLIHTAATTINFKDAASVSGQIIWDDEDDYDKMRATTSDIQVGIAEIGRGDVKTFVDSTLVSPTQNGVDANRWDYTITNTTLPKYKDGAAVYYGLGVKILNTWGVAKSNHYNFSLDGNNFTAISTPRKTEVYVTVRWADDAQSRPTSLKVIIKGKVGQGAYQTLDTKTIDYENDGWSARYSMNYFTRADSYVIDENRTKYSSFTIEITGSDGNPVANYLAPAITATGSGSATFDVLMKQDGYNFGPSTDVINLIAALGEPVYTPEYKAQLDGARNAYKALSETNQKLVTNLSHLETREAQYTEKFSHLIAIDAAIEEVYAGYMSKKVSQMNDYLRSVTRDVLTLSVDERNSLWHLDHYNAILNHVAKEGGMVAVYHMIYAIGDVTLTEGCKTNIDAARTAYNALTSAEKATIDNYDVLCQAEAEYFALYFLNATDSICSAGGESADHSSALTAAWSDLSSKWNALGADVQALLKDAEAEDPIGNFYARYIHIVNRYGQTYAFTNGPVVAQAQPSISNIETQSSSAELPVALIASISAFALVAGTVFFLKRKSTN